MRRPTSNGVRPSLFSYLKLCIVMINKKTDDLCLVVTERCNLNCSYCQSDKSFNRMMSWECAKENVDRYLSITEELSTLIQGDIIDYFPNIRFIRKSFI